MRETVRKWLATELVFREVASFVCRQGAEVYLVGGTVRDLLAGRASYDMDLAVAGDAMGLARRVADAVGGAYVAMDAERDVARVVVGARQRPAGAARIIDLAGLRAGTIADDLRARDFSVNAMAVSLCRPEEGLLDPIGGMRDLGSRVLRATHPGVFSDDPLRILRGVRLRGALGWEIVPETERLMRAWAPSLSRVSPERVRDELAQILALDGAAAGLTYAHGLGALAPALPAVPVTALDGGMAMVGGIERLQSARARDGRLPGGLARHLRAYLGEELSGGRSRKVALRLAALLYDCRETAGAAAEGLHLSAREARLVAGAVDAAHALRERDAARSPSRLEVYRYFRRAGEAGVAGAMLALAAGLNRSEYEALAASVAVLLRAWFEERRQAIEPPPLLTGREVMAELGIGPGPRVGQALEALREAQVQGLVATPEGARAYLRRMGT